MGSEGLSGQRLQGEYYYLVLFQQLAGSQTRPQFPQREHNLYQVKLLARKPEKVTKVLSQLFDAATLETHQENITVVAGGVMDEAVLDELLEGTQAVLSFLGMVDPKVWVVSPGMESILNGLKRIVAGGGSPPKLVSMSAMGIGNSFEQMKASNWFMGRLTAWVIIPYMLKSCFDDLEASEKMIQAEWDQEDSNLNISIIRFVSALLMLHLIRPANGPLWRRSK